MSCELFESRKQRALKLLLNPVVKLHLLLILTFVCLSTSAPFASAQAAAQASAPQSALVPEILALKNDQLIPTAVIRSYSVDAIAQTLMTRLHRLNEPSANVSRPAFDYMKSALLQMKFKSELFTKISRDGFLNQHQTGTSNGYLGGDYRSQVEDSLIRLHLESAYTAGRSRINAIRPKYAFLTFPKDSTGDQRGDFVRSYGNIVAVFKDEVKYRSTFTAVDSLNGDSANLGDVVAHTFLYRSSEALAKVKDVNGTDYWEAQIWGSLTIQRDVAYFLLQCPGDDAIDAATLDQMKASKIPLFQCAYVDDHSHFGKGDAL